MSESRAPERVWRTTLARARASLARAVSQDLQALDVALGEAALSGQRRLRDAEDRRGRQALLAQHRREVRPDLGHGLGRHAVEHDRHRGAPFGGLAQQLPGDGVGIARGRRDEQPQVGGREQLGRQRPVGRDHGVDVGGVEQRHAGRQGARGDQTHGPRAVLAGPARDPAQAGQHPVAGEPVAVLGVVDQDRADRGRAEDARTADLGVDDGVDQSGLAGARRAADDGQQRGVEGGQAGHDVVVELPEQRLAVDLGGLCLGDVEWEAGGGHLGPQCRYRTQQCRALVPLPTHGARLTNPGHTERTAAPVSAKGSSKSSTGTGPTA